MSKLFCFGLGYTAEAFAKRMAAAGWHVSGTSRTPEGVAHINSLGFDGFLFDGDSPGAGITGAINGATHVLVSTSPPEAGDPVLNHHKDSIESAPHLKWIGYLSTIGVYGNTNGAWVDETTRPNPSSPRTLRRVHAENAWLAIGKSLNVKTEIYRLGGIYGPGRSAIDDVRAGTARRIIKPGQVFNRIHVDDIAAVLDAGASLRGRHHVYNVTDNEPAPPQDVVAHAADLLGVSPPPAIPFEDAPLSPMGRSFYSDNRRIRNTRLSEDLSVTLKYPSYREGLVQIMALT